MIRAVTLAQDNLARVYHLLGRDQEAVPLLEATLAAREYTLGRDHPYVAITLDDLA